MSGLLSYARMLEIDADLRARADKARERGLDSAADDLERAAGLVNSAADRIAAAERRKL